MVADWSFLLSSTESALLHIARAFIANPEVMCLHKPVLHLSQQMGDNIYKVLQEYVLMPHRLGSQVVTMVVSFTKKKDDWIMTTHRFHIDAVTFESFVSFLIASNGNEINDLNASSLWLMAQG